MNRDMILQINRFGQQNGFPVFVMTDGRIVKVPATSEIFQYVVMREIDAYASLSSQEVYRYEDWLQMKNPVKARVHPLTEGLPYFPFVPDTMPVETYQKNSNIYYVLALLEIRQQFKVSFYTDAAGWDCCTCSSLGGLCLAKASFVRGSKAGKNVYYVYSPTANPKILKNSGDSFYAREKFSSRCRGAELVEQYQFSRKIDNEEETIYIELSRY